MDFPVDDLAALLIRLFEEAGRRLLLVGGTVRDLLLGETPSDADFSTDAPPDESKRILEAAGLRVYETGIRFGTVSAVACTPGGMRRAEITTFRTEAYEPGSRKPSVSFDAGLEQDLLRRDFTINAMAMDGTGRILDPWGGRDDLAAGVLRTPGDPMVTMREDPLRMLRAARFAGRFGLEPEPALVEAVRSCSALLGGVAVERRLMELDSMLSMDGPGASAAMREVASLGLLGACLPELEPMFLTDGLDQGRHHAAGVWTHTLCVLERVPPGLRLRWAALFHDSGKPAARTVDSCGEPHYHGHPAAGARLASIAAARLRFPARRAKDVARLVELHPRPADYRPGWTPSAVRRLAAAAGDLLEDLLILSEADSACRADGSATCRTVLLAELRRRLEDPALSGRIRLVPPGVGAILARRTGDRTAEAIEVLEDLAADGAISPSATPDEFVSLLAERRPDLLGPGRDTKGGGS
jgi:poly(A) polymerase